MFPRFDNICETSMRFQILNFDDIWKENSKKKKKKSCPGRNLQLQKQNNSNKWRRESQNNHIIAQSPFSLAIPFSSDAWYPSSLHHWYESDFVWMNLNSKTLGMFITKLLVSSATNTNYKINKNISSKLPYM